MGVTYPATKPLKLHVQLEDCNTDVLLTAEGEPVLPAFIPLPENVAAFHINGRWHLVTKSLPEKEIESLEWQAREALKAGRGE